MFNLNITSLFNQISSGLLQTVINDKIDNPYLKAVLNPLASIFVSGIMNGAGLDAMSAQAAGVIEKTQGDALGVAAAKLPEIPSALDINPVYEHAINELVAG